MTTTHYLRLGAERVREREERLRGFNRMVSHELKNQIGAVLGAGQLLADPEISANPAQRERFARIVVENAGAMQGALENLIELSRMDSGMRRQRNVVLPSVVAEVVRQLREMALARGVEVRIDPAIPEVEVNAAAVELALTNYVSNAIKYSDPDAEHRWVEIRAAVTPAGTLRVEVEDNGLGVPPEKRGELFTRFFRAHHETVTGVEGTGLGLSIVRETAEGLDGEAWAEFDRPRGSRFLLSLPSRRMEDARGRGDGGGSLPPRGGGA